MGVLRSVRKLQSHLATPSVCQHANLQLEAQGRSCLHHLRHCLQPFEAVLVLLETHHLIHLRHQSKSNCRSLRHFVPFRQCGGPYTGIYMCAEMMYEMSCIDAHLETFAVCVLVFPFLAVDHPLAQVPRLKPSLHLTLHHLQGA